MNVCITESLCCTVEINNAVNQWYFNEINLKTHILLNIIIDSIDMNFSKLQDIGEDREAWCAVVHKVARVEHDLVTEQQNTFWKTYFFKI